MLIYHLPTELVYSIFSKLQSQDDLLNLAMTCREFYDITLDIIFKRYRMDPNSQTLLLNFHSNNVECLSALGVWLKMRPNFRLKRLEFRYRRYADLKGAVSIYNDLKAVRSYILKLGSVDDAHLLFVAPTEATTPDVGEATVEMLRAIVERKCLSLHVSTIRLIDTRSQDEEPFPDRPTNWVWRKVHIGYIPHNENGRLKKCTIYTYPVFLRQFYYDALQSNSNTLTELCFHQIHDGLEDWKAMMSALRLPRLRCLRISGCYILQQPVVKFLSYHLNLVTLQYHHIGYAADSPPPVTSRLSPNSFNNLEELITAPKYLKDFIPDVSMLPSLRVLVIHVDVSRPPDFSDAEEALAALRGCINPIDLKLYITTEPLGFEAWIKTIEALPGGVMAASDQRPERLLFPIRSLTFYNGSCGWNVDRVTRMMQWVLLFPALEEVTFDADPKSVDVIKMSREGPGESALLTEFRRIGLKGIKVLIKSPARDISLILE